MVKTETYTLNMGPQHPSTHGVLQVVLELDGEEVVQAVPHMGYLHRGIEKLAESRTYPQFIPYTDRLDYVASMCNNLAYCQTVEKLMQVVTTPGFCTEQIGLYLATELSQHEDHPDPDEFLHVEKLPLAEAVRRVMAGELRDAKTALGLLMAWEKLRG